VKYRKLGNSDITVSEIGIGTWEFSGDVWGPTDDDTSKRAILAGVDEGANFIDSAAGYGGGHVEELLGAMFASGALTRSDVVISTKVKPQNGVFAPAAEVSIDDAYSPEWIRGQVEDSLKRLQTDYVDLLFIHTWSKAWDSREEWSECLQDLKKEGLVRAVGISVPDEGAADANTHIEAGRVDVIQAVFSAFQQEPEYTLLPLAAKHGVGVIARSPYSSGAIVQPWTADKKFEEGDWRASWPLSVKPGWLEDQASMSALVQDAFGRHGVEFTTGALGYVLEHSAVSSTIPGSANPDHVRINMRVSDAPAVPAALSAELKQLWLERKLHGTYNGSI
jgi:aryl-alcohol dehydrogenase-like predicted oxidoreductase